MGGFISGLTIGLFVGVSGTFLLILGRVAFSTEGFSTLSRLSYRSVVFTTAMLVILAIAAHSMKLGKASSLLLLLLAVLAIARHGGLIYGLVATAVAAISLSVWFFPPIGSLMITKPHDRVALSLFLLTATLGSRFFGERRTSVKKSM
jgi:K+-sensing histidine kinase KdpD